MIPSGAGTIQFAILVRLYMEHQIRLPVQCTFTSGTEEITKTNEKFLPYLNRLSVQFNCVTPFTDTFSTGAVVV